MSDQRLLRGKVQPACARSGGNNERPGMNDLVAEVQLERVLGKVYRGEMSHAQLGAEADCLLLHVLDQLGTLNAVGPAGKVFDQRGDGQLAAGLVAFEHQGLEVRAGGVDGGGQSGAAGTEDDGIASIVFWHMNSTSVNARFGKRMQSAFSDTIEAMANLTLVYGMRLLPADEIAAVGDAPVTLNNGNEAHVTMHVLEGSREQIEAQLRMSIDAFFDFYPEI